MLEGGGGGRESERQTDRQTDRDRGREKREETDHVSRDGVNVENVKSSIANDAKILGGAWTNVEQENEGKNARQQSKLSAHRQQFCSRKKEKTRRSNH
jgi:hypothetical protein